MGVIRIVSTSNAALSVLVVAAVVVEGVSFVAKDFVAVVFIVVVEGVSFAAKDVSSFVAKDDSSINIVVEGVFTIVEFPLV